MTNQLEGRTVARSIPEPTKPKPFNLTVSKARIVPIPKIVRRGFSHALGFPLCI